MDILSVYKSHSVHLAGMQPPDSYSKSFSGKGSVTCILLYKFTKESSLVQKGWMLRYSP